MDSRRVYCLAPCSCRAWFEPCVQRAGPWGIPAATIWPLRPHWRSLPLYGNAGPHASQKPADHALLAEQHLIDDTFQQFLLAAVMFRRQGMLIGICRQVGQG